MKQRLVIVLFAVLLAAGLVWGQIALDRATAYGKVTGRGGIPLPGVTVVIHGEGTTPRNTATGEDGTFLLAGLLPGDYQVTYSLLGFTEMASSVRIGIGQEVDLSMAMCQWGDFVTIDVSKPSESYGVDYLQNIPSARDPWAILDQAPGLDLDGVNVGGVRSGQQAIYTAKGGASSTGLWCYDGMDITDPAALGASSAYYDFDSLQEIQIATGAQDPAIPTGGVVISMVTKRGGDMWSGSASYYIDDAALQDNNMDEDLIQRHFLEPEKVDLNWELGGDFGGPLVKNHVWSWGAYRYQHLSSFTPRYQLHNAPFLNLDSVLGGAREFIRLSNVNAKTSVAYNKENEGYFQYFFGNKDFDNRFSNLPLPQAPETAWNQHGPTQMFRFEHTWIPAERWFLDARYSYLDNKFNLDPVAGVGPDAQPVYREMGGYFLENGNYFDHTKRLVQNLTLDADRFVPDRWGGDHELKFGFAYRHASVTTSRQYGGDILLYDYTHSVGERSLGAGLAILHYLRHPKDALNSTSVYVADALRLEHLTLNLGVRYQHDTSEARPTDAPANSVAPDFLPALSFSGDSNLPSFNTLAPRLGAAWDVTGSGKTVIQGNYARFYEGFGTQLADFVNPLGSWDAGLYTYYADANGDGQVTRDELSLGYYWYATPGLVAGDAAATVDEFRSLRSIEQNLKPQVSTEYLLGVERQLNEDMSVSVAYTHRMYDRIQDVYIPGVTADDFVCGQRTVMNPVTGETFQSNVCVPPPSAVREIVNASGRTRSYSGLEFSLNKRMSNNWMARGSATVQDQKLHFADNAAVYPGSYQDPTNVGYTKDQWWAQQSTEYGSGGVFTGSRWSFKLSGTYQFPWFITAGAFLRVTDGNVTPIIVQRSALALPFGSERLDSVKTLDVRVEKAFVVGGFARLGVAADIFNIFNANTVLQIDRRAYAYQFREPEQIVSPRILRLGFRFQF